MKPVLILSEPGDAHALTVAARLEQRHNCEAFIWDASRFPATDTLTHHISGSREIIELDSRATGRVELRDYRSVWWRRVRPPIIRSEVHVEAVRMHCRTETTTMLRGVLAASNVPVVNDPKCEDWAGKKPLQLATAQLVGLSIPNTLITNDAAAVQDFFEAHEGQIIFKPLTSRPAPLGGTQLVESSYLAGLNLLANAPAIFQELIPPAHDVRVTVVGEQVFAGISGSELLDWRLEPELTWDYHALPEAIRWQVLALMAALGLTIASIDFRLTHEGEYVFFEINPNGQFLFLEVASTNLPISAALADLLVSV